MVGEDSYASKRNSPRKRNLGEEDSFLSSSQSDGFFQMICLTQNSNGFAIDMSIITIIPLIRWMSFYLIAYELTNLACKPSTWLTC